MYLHFIVGALERRRGGFVRATWYESPATTSRSGMYLDSIARDIAQVSLLASLYTTMFGRKLLEHSASRAQIGSGDVLLVCSLAAIASKCLAWSPL